MKIKLLMLTACFFLCSGLALAQTKTVSGVVTSGDNGEPVVGATVLVKGANHGVITDVNGRFTLSDIPSSANAIVVSSVGMESQEMPVREGVEMRITLMPSSELLDEVVVTAMGITRMEKTLGYAATTVKGEDIIGARTTNVADALSGRIAGVQVNTTSTDPGSVTNIVIRGYSSIKNSNQPLYIVDGVPLGEDLVSEQGKNISTAGISNLAAEDIETMTVLKGAAATALYGSRAANGVILITTKSGKKGNGRNFTISYSGSIQARQVSTLPELQNDFGQGWAGVQTFIENGSWGPALDGSTQVYGPIWNNQQLVHEYSALEDNIKEFFDIGWSQNHNISLGGVSNDEKMTYYLSYSYTGDDGIMPTDADKYERNTIAFRSSYETTDWLKLSSSVNFANTSTDAVGSYQGLSVMNALFETPRDVSLLDMQDLSSAFNTPDAFYTPYGVTNPYWVIANNYNHTSAKQIYGKLQADIMPIDQLTLTYRFGFDYSDYDQKIGTPEIDPDNSLLSGNYGYDNSYVKQTGSVNTSYARRYELNHDIMANFKDKYLDDKLDVNVTAGLNINERYTTRMTGQTDGLTFDTGFWDLGNGATRSRLGERQTKRRLIGLFGDVTIGWDDMLYLDISARNDWSSTLPIDANSFFYPGVTLSWVFTELIPKNDILSFGKLRLAYGKTGNDASEYQVEASYEQGYVDTDYYTDIVSFPKNGVNSFVMASYKGSNNLRPEMTTEFEAGVNLQFFGGRIGLDAAYYNKETKDQILTVPVDPMTGYSFMVANFGTVRNRGIELLLTTIPVKTKDFRWELAFNFSKNNNKVVSLPDRFEGGKVEILGIATGFINHMYAEVGKPIGQYYAYLPTYTEDGQMIVDANGLPVLTTEVQDTGKNMNSDWTGGVTTALSYKDFTLSAALDIRKGGYMFSHTPHEMMFSGSGIVTTYNSRRPFIIPNSVVDNGDGTYSENTTAIYPTDGSLQSYYATYGGGMGGDSYFVDRSFVKLRNISLTWNVPRKWVSAMSLSELSLTLFCNNLFTWTAADNYYIDPEITTEPQEDYGDLATTYGESYGNPACRTFGCNISVKF